VNEEPWYDYLAIPIAPAVLLVQLSALFIKSRQMRVILGLACPASIFAMFLYVASIDLEPGEGANIGAGVMLLWFVLSLIVLGVALVRELVGVGFRRFFASRRREPL
jgi:hypothetical protein